MSNQKIDQAFQLFHEKKYTKASTAFQEILGDAELAPWIKIRIVQFKKISDNEGAEKITNGASLKMFSFHLNLHRFDQAQAILDQLELKEDEKLYLSAELAVEKGDLENGIELLKEAIKLNKHNAGYALNSPSFSLHLTEEAFSFLRGDEEKPAKPTAAPLGDLASEGSDDEVNENDDDGEANLDDDGNEDGTEEGASFDEDDDDDDIDDTANDDDDDTADDDTADDDAADAEADANDDIDDEDDDLD